MKTAVITGASSGIGKEAAKAMARAGWRIIAIGRDPDRASAAEEEIRAQSANGAVTMLIADLSLLAQARRVAADIAVLTDRVDVLINNAGKMATDKVMTTEGLEENFAGNHLGPFVLTNALLPLLLRAAANTPAGAVRIVNTSSDASEMIPGMPWDDLQNLESFRSGAAYCTAKLANVLHVKALAARLADAGIVAHALHPGTVASNFITHAPESSQAYMRTLTAMTPAEAAEPLVWLATADETGQTTGGYYHQHTRVPHPVAEQDGDAERLWAQSEALVAASA